MLINFVESLHLFSPHIKEFNHQEYDTRDLVVVVGVDLLTILTYKNLECSVDDLVFKITTLDRSTQNRPGGPLRLRVFPNYW